MSLLIAVVALGFVVPAGARRDPLNDLEIEELREAAQDPPKRLKLLLKFTRDRMALIDALRAEPGGSKDRSRRMHDLLEDFGILVDELDNNVETYAARKSDLRKPLRAIVQADNEFLEKLRSLKAIAAADPALAEEAKEYEFILEDVTDSVQASLETALETLQAQDLAARDPKKKR